MFLSRFFKSCLGSPAGSSSSGDKYQVAEPQSIISNKRSSVSSAKGSHTVVPVDRDIVTDNERPSIQDSSIQSEVRQKNIRTIRVAEITSSRSIGDLEKECLSIMEMIKVITPEDRKQKRHPLDDPSKILRYDIHEPSHGVSGAPKVKQVTSMRKILFRTILRENARDSKENDLTEMVMVTMDILDLLERNKAKIMTPRKYASKLPGVAYEWSTEGSLMLFDLLLLTMHDHVSSADVYSVAPLTVTWYKALEEICVGVKANIIIQTRSDSSKVDSFQRISDFLFQCVARASKLVRMVGVCCLVSKSLPLPSMENVASLARSLQSLADCITLRQRESEKDASYTVRMLFWGACDALLGLVDQMGSMHGRLIAQAQDPSSGNASINISNSNILGVILSSLAASSPGPMEMCIEINRIQTFKSTPIATMPQPALTPLPGYSLAIPDSPENSTAASSPEARSTNPNLTSSSPQTNANAWEGTAATLNLLIIDSSKNMKALSELFNAELLTADSIRLYYLIYGLQRALRADILNTARHRSVRESAKATRRLRDQWLTTLADSLLLVLDQDWRSAPYGLSHEEFRKGNGSLLLSARGEPSLLSSRGGALSARLSARASGRGPASARALMIAGGGATPGSNTTQARGDNKYNLLIVDDSHMNRKMIRKVLVNAGHRCEEAEDGLLSIAKVLEKQTSTTALYDGILMDFVMPNMDGPTATKALRAMGYNGVIIGVTGNQLSADIEHFLECGANKVLMKPLVVEQFRQAMEAGNVSGTNNIKQKKKRGVAADDQQSHIKNKVAPVEKQAEGVYYDVLIVDDSIINRKMISRMLTKVGHACDEAEDGLQAIMRAKSKLEQSKMGGGGASKQQSYDVVLMDFVMPNMDGPTTTKALRAMGYDGIILGLTGNHDTEFEHFINCGGNKVLSKPMHLDQFTITMEKLVKKRKKIVQKEEEKSRMMAPMSPTPGGSRGRSGSISRPRMQSISRPRVDPMLAGDPVDLVNSANAAFKCLSLAPALAEMLFEVVYGFTGVNGDDGEGDTGGGGGGVTSIALPGAGAGGVDWVYWELSRRMAGFIQRDRKGKAASRSLYKKIARSTMNTARSSMSASTRHTPVASFFGTLTSPGGDNTTSALSSEFDEGAMAMRRLLLVAQQEKLNSFQGVAESGYNSLINSSRKPSLKSEADVSTTAPPPLVFAIDDQVDGLVTLKSGVQRWFPARIKALNNTTGTLDKYTYTLEYRDGDVQEDKGVDEVRRSKSRSKGGSGGGSVAVIAGAVPTSTPGAGAGAVSARPPVAIEIFAIDDSVDGLVTLSSGAQRWFPARIKALNNTTGTPDKYTYTLEYRDGDVQEDKGVEVIRRTKSRGRVATSAAGAGAATVNPTAVFSSSPLMNWRPQPIPTPTIAAPTPTPASSVPVTTLTLSSNGGGSGSGSGGQCSKSLSLSLSVKIDDADLIPTRLPMAPSPRGSPLSITISPAASLSARLNPLLSPSGSPVGLNNDNLSPRPGSAGSCDSGGSYGSDGDEIFTIPSVFATARVEAKVSMVSKMNLKNLPISSAANEGGAFSLSMSLTMEVPENNADVLRALDGFGEDEDDDDLGDADDQSVVNELFNELQSPLPLEEEEEAVQEALLGSSDVPPSPLSLAFSLSPSPSPFTKRPSTPPMNNKRPSTPPTNSGNSSRQDSPISPFGKRPSTPPMSSANVNALPQSGTSNIRTEGPVVSPSPFTIPSSGKRPISPPMSSGKSIGSSPSITSGKSLGGGGGSRPPLGGYNNYNSGGGGTSLFAGPTGQIHHGTGLRGSFESVGGTGMYQESGLNSRASFDSAGDYDNYNNNEINDNTHGSMLRASQKAAPSSVPSLGLGGIASFLGTTTMDFNSMGMSYDVAANGSKHASTGKLNDSGRNTPHEMVGDDQEMVQAGLTAAFSIVAGMSEETNEVLLRTFSIISAILMGRCVVGGGLFLDPTTCRPRLMGEPKSGFRRDTSDRKGGRLSLTGTGTANGTGRTAGSDSTAALTEQSLTPLGSVAVAGGGAVSGVAVSDSTASSPIAAVQLNMMYTVREFLDGLPDYQLRHSIVPHLVQLSNFTGGGSMRMLKLLTKGAFHSCLPAHLKNSAQKIGDGGFGSVFKVTCDPRTCRHAYHCTSSPSTTLCQFIKSCPQSSSSETRDNSGMVLPVSSRINDNYKRPPRSSHSSTDTPPFAIFNTNDTNAVPALALAPRTFAVKRLARERSGFDNSLIYEIFNEIAALELLSGAGCQQGVCALMDYGVHEGEYWMVMEAGSMDLLAWRKTLGRERVRGLTVIGDPANTTSKYNEEDAATNTNSMDSTPVVPSVKDEEEGFLPLTSQGLAMCLALYVDALMIVEAVHSAHVLHFDIKCNNFILRVPPSQLDMAILRESHARGEPSGLLFLADFGEAVTLKAPAGGGAERKGGPGVEVGVDVSGEDNLPPEGGGASDGPSTRARSRGTLPIQSPEMICLNITTTTTTTTTNNNGSSTIGEALNAQSDKIDTTTSKTAPSRKTFPAPGRASDVWSMGCLLVELVTGGFFMAERSWTDLYVSLCLPKYVPPTLRDFHTALEPINEGIADELCNILGRTFAQDPGARARIIDLFQAVTHVLNAHDLLGFVSAEKTKSIKTSRNSNNNATTNSSNNNKVTEGGVIPSASSSPPPPTPAPSSFPPADVALEKEWKCVEWTKERVRLRPTCVDFRCASLGGATGQELGLRVVIALLASNGSLPGNVVIPWDNNTTHNTNNNSVHGNIYNSNNYNSATAIGTSPLDVTGPGLALVPFALDKITASFVSKPSLNCISYVPSSLDSTAANKVGDDTIDEGKEEKEDDARGWLQEELGGVAGHLASASLQSCARFVAEKTMLDVVWGTTTSSSSTEGQGPGLGQGQGLGPNRRALHIDIAYSKSVEEPLVVTMPGALSSIGGVDGGGGGGGGGGRIHVQLFLPLTGEGDERVSDAAVLESIQRVTKEALDTVQQSGPWSLVVISVLPHPVNPMDLYNPHKSDHRQSDKRMSQRSSFGNDIVPRWNQHHSTAASMMMGMTNQSSSSELLTPMISSRGGEPDHPENEVSPDACDYMLTGVTLAIALAERFAGVGGGSGGGGGGASSNQHSTANPLSAEEKKAINTHTTTSDNIDITDINGDNDTRQNSPINGQRNVDNDSGNGNGSNRATTTTTTTMNRELYLDTLRSTIARQQSKPVQPVAPYGAARALQVHQAASVALGPLAVAPWIRKALHVEFREFLAVHLKWP